MTAKSAIEELELIDTAEPPPPTRRGDSGWGGGEGFGRAQARDPETYVTGIWVALASILMFFLALTSSFIVRKGMGQDWQPIELPRVLWATTTLLLLSSVALERARRALATGARAVYSRWWTLTTMLGVFFLCGQIVAWSQLWASGVFLATNPSSSFFYLLTGTHGLHLLGGLIALSYVGARSRRASRTFGTWPAERPAVTATSIYWHFLGVLWVLLFLLLLLGR